jgi:hypothetical protein
MGGGAYIPPLGRFNPPSIKGKGFAVAIGACYWFFLGYRAYHDGGHHFLHKHAWEEPRIIKYLDEVDAKYGTRLGIDNMHH